MACKVRWRRKELKVEIVRCHQILLNNSEVTSLWLFVAVLLLFSPSLSPCLWGLRSVQRERNIRVFSVVVIHLFNFSFILFFFSSFAIFGHFALKYLPFTFYLLIIYHSVCFKFSFVVLLCHPFSCVDRLISFFSSFVVGREKKMK